MNQRQLNELVRRVEELEARVKTLEAKRKPGPKPKDGAD